MIILISFDVVCSTGLPNPPRICTLYGPFFIQVRQIHWRTSSLFQNRLLTCRKNPLIHLQVCKQAKPKTSGIRPSVHIYSHPPTIRIHFTTHRRRGLLPRYVFILYLCVLWRKMYLYTYASHRTNTMSGAGSGWLCLPLRFMFSVKIHWITFTWTCYAILWRICMYGMMSASCIVCWMIVWEYRPRQAKSR